jgi:hypothetical protein
MERGVGDGVGFARPDCAEILLAKVAKNTKNKCAVSDLSSRLFDYENHSKYASTKINFTTANNKIAQTRLFKAWHCLSNIEEY